MTAKFFSKDSVCIQEYVYTQLRSNVIEFKYKPGQHLCIPSLADQLGVSPTPVREALQCLYKESLITMTPNRGFFSLVPHLDEMRDLFCTLNICLAAALSISTRPGSCAKPNAIEVFDQGVCARGRADFIELKLKRVGEAARNAVLLETIRGLLSRTHALRLIDLECDQVFGDETHAHERIQRLCEDGCATDGVGVLAALHDSQQQRLPGLVKEAISRMHLS